MQMDSLSATPTTMRFAISMVMLAVGQNYYVCDNVHVERCFSGYELLQWTEGESIVKAKVVRFSWKSLLWSMWIVKVLGEDRTLSYCSSVLRQQKSQLLLDESCIGNHWRQTRVCYKGSEHRYCFAVLGELPIEFNCNLLEFLSWNKYPSWTEPPRYNTFVSMAKSAKYRMWCNNGNPTVLNNPNPFLSKAKRCR
jgi:hypothetical protein